MVKATRDKAVPPGRRCQTVLEEMAREVREVGMYRSYYAGELLNAVGACVSRQEQSGELHVESKLEMADGSWTILASWPRMVERDGEFGPAANG